MLRLSIVICLAVAVVGQQRFDRQRFGQTQFGQTQNGQPQLRQQRFGQQQFGQSQFGQPQQAQQQFGRSQFGQPQQQIEQPQIRQSPRVQQQGQPLGQQQASAPVPILRMNNDQSPDGAFQYDYASADSAVVEAQGEQRQIGDGVGTVMQGSYSYTAPNGELIEVRWIADENGFQPIVSRSPSQ